MDIEAIKIQAAALREYYDRLPMPDALREKALVVYAKKTLLDLEAALLNPEKAENPLEDFLNRNWALVNGTILSPTVIPDADITKLLCDVAMLLADEKNKDLPKDNDPATPHQLLMPTVPVESLRDNYPNLNEIPLSTALKTHILGRRGEFLLPVKLLTELDLSPEAIHLNHPYPPMISIDPSIYLVAPEEYARLVGHSPLTQAVGDAKQQYDVLANDKSTLLGQLGELCSKLGLYSVTGLGTETHAAAGAYAPIIVFNDYYNQLDETQKGAIPVPLKDEIDKLLELASNPEANINATENVETCIATRRSALMERMRGHETILDRIAVSGARKESLLDEAKAQFERARLALKTAVETNTYEGGYDHLNLNRNLLRELDLPFSVSSLQDLNVFKALRADEMSELLESPELAAQIIGEIGNLENLVVFILDLSSEKTSAFLNASQRDVARQFISSPEDLAALLISLDVEKCTAVCQGLKNELPNIIKTGGNLSTVLSDLNREQRTVVYDALQGEVPTIVKNGGDLNTTLLYLTPEQRRAVIDAIKIELPRMLTGSQFHRIMQYLEPQECAAVIESIKSELPRMIKRGADLSALLRHLPTEASAAIIDALKSELPNMIQAPGGSDDLFRSLTHEQRSAVFDAIKSALPMMIKTVVGFRDLLAHLTPEQCTVVYDAIKDDLPKTIKTSWDVSAVLRYLPPELRTAVYESIKNELPKIIRTDEDLRDVLEYLTPAQCSAVIDTIKIDLPKIIVRAKHLGSLMRALTPEQNAAMMDSMRSTLPNIIENGRDLGDVLLRQPPELQAAILDALKSELPKIIQTYKGLIALMQNLPPEQCTAVINTLKSELPNMLANQRFFYELQRLTSAQSMAVIDAMKSELPNMIMTGEDFRDALDDLDPEVHVAVIDAMGSQILALESIYDSEPPIPSDELNNIIAFIKNAPKTESAKLFASAVMDNDVEKIKTSLVMLAQEPREALVKEINALGPKWKDRIKSALGLADELSEEVLYGLIRQPMAPKESHPSDVFKSLLQDLNPENIEKTLKKNLTEYINEQSKQDISQGNGVEIEVARKLMKHMDGQAQLFNASEKECLTQGHLGELIKKCPEIMDAIQRQELAPR